MKQIIKFANQNKFLNKLNFLNQRQSLQLINDNRQRRFQRIYYNEAKNIESKNKFLLFVYFENEQYYNNKSYDETLQKVVYNIIFIKIDQNINKKKNNSDNMNDNQNTTNIIFIKKISIIFSCKFYNEKFILNNKFYRHVRQTRHQFKLITNFVVIF